MDLNVGCKNNRNVDDEEKDVQVENNSEEDEEEDEEEDGEGDNEEDEDDDGEEDGEEDNEEDDDGEEDGEEDNEEDEDDDEEEDGEEDDNDEYEDDEDEPDFMDNSGKCWEFSSKIVDEKHLKEWCQNKMGGMIVGKEEKLTRQFHCQIEECQFKAIFLKSCSIVYTRNKHNHAVKNAKNIKEKQEKNTNPRDYVDQYGKLWPFCADMGKNISQNIFHSKFGFIRILKRKQTLNLHCQKKNPTGGRCPFAGIYLKSNGFLYTRGKHEHTKRGKKPQNIGDDYVDRFGNNWKFNKEIGKKVKHEIFLNELGFGNIIKMESGFNLHCGKKAPNGRCKFSGIYLNSNGCLYTRRKHEHALLGRNPKPSVGDDYVDYAGKLWTFHSKIGKQPIPDEIWRNKFGFTQICFRKQTINLYCKKMTNRKFCAFTGIYVKENGCLYIRGKHEHK